MFPAIRNRVEFEEIILYIYIYIYAIYTNNCWCLYMYECMFVCVFLFLCETECMGV